MSRHFFGALQFSISAIVMGCPHRCRRQPVRAITLISAEDAPERDPSSFVLEGSDDGTNFSRIASNAGPAFPTRHFVQSVAFPNTNVFNFYRVLFPTVSNAAAANSMQIATMTRAAPSSNLQIQEFSTSSNTTAFARYRITFGPPVGGDRIQVGEMRLFGEIIPVVLPPPILSARSSGNNVLVSWLSNPGYVLETRTDLNVTNWTAVATAPVLSNGVNTVALPTSETSAFFRLRK